ncbi:phosphoglycolate phosphatase [Marchantia polymorpha subsp. ruderalis]|uniref:Thioredoxin domain-containing protein n=2 Tax=Marchantia polymorpha TaxID=3197 RepID=A0AAF6BL51_MARPO|nr:hypothetical protein MARPO_0010s0206 [Marchantia polymorpha]BBN12735.1 hypothetical protein Mp_5g22510 [Marchantia polymorpha subsp. ruderalis]|eukprot:PTQ46846.1 hypothetical protein MARPO_0010s0206 [Marchantia polymorpha]
MEAMVVARGLPPFVPSTRVQRVPAPLKNFQRASLSPKNPAISTPFSPIPSSVSTAACAGKAGLRGGKVERCLAMAGGEGGAAEAAPVRGVLFDMDGVLCESEGPSRDAAVALFAEKGVTVTAEDFIPFMGTGEANFLGGVARKYGLDFDVDAFKKRFFEIYIEKYAQPNSGLGYPGALNLILECKKAGLKLAVASSADRVKVDANLAAAGLPQTNFDAVVSADLFENLKPAPDIFLAAAKALGLPPQECVVIEDALAGVQAARAAGMRCIAVTTTLAGPKLMSAGPSVIKKSITEITLEDILTLQEPGSGSRDTGFDFMWEESELGFFDSMREKMDLDQELALPLGYLTTRRDVFKLTSFALGLSSIAFTATHMKAMSYASPMAIWNALVGEMRPVANGAELSTGDRVEQFKKYIADIEKKGKGQVVAEFQPKLEWLNSPPLRLQSDLRGKLVLLDFWTYCCINCMHVLPDLAYLEKKFKGQPFTVIGVHSAKFDNEKDSNAIRNAVLRYDVTHPVVNDGEMTMWRQLGVSSWPTLALVGPTGRLVAMLAGEGHRKDLDDLVAAALQYYGEKGLLNDKPIPEALEKDKDSRLVASPLKFPGKLATDLANQRLFISDSNNHRIVVTDLEGNFIMQIGGGGGEGLRDGSFDYAAFNRPQGLTYNPSKNVLYVADTENHAVREIDFVNEKVRTLAGNGEKGSDYKGGKKGSSQVLNSPWDVCLDSSCKVLYVAMAGQHQIWQIDPSDGLARNFSGDGYERNLNGKNGSSTSYAQPSGLSLGPDGQQMFIADSESSSVRAVDLRSGGSQLLAGGDPVFADNLFQFGDKDGFGSKALLQHPLGVLYGSDGLIYVADSYNHKIKVLEKGSQKVTSLAGLGKAGFKDGPASSAQLSEPAGLAQGPNGKIYVADTNNSLIRVLNVGANPPTIETLELKGVPPPPPAPASAPRRLRRRLTSDVEIVNVDPVSSMNGDLELQISLPKEFHFTAEAQSKFEVDVEPDGSVSIEPMNGIIGNDGRAKLRFSRSSNDSSSGSVRISCKVYYCQEDAVCLYKGVAFEVPFNSAQENAQTSISIPYLVKPKTSTKNSLTSV